MGFKQLSFQTNSHGADGRIPGVQVRARSKAFSRRPFPRSRLTRGGRRTMDGEEGGTCSARCSPEPRTAMPPAGAAVTAAFGAVKGQGRVARQARCGETATGAQPAQMVQGALPGDGLWSECAVVSD